MSYRVIIPQHKRYINVIYSYEMSIMLTCICVMLCQVMNRSLLGVYINDIIVCLLRQQVNTTELQAVMTLLQII